MMLYRFHCWEEDNRTFLPSLTAICKRTGRIAYYVSAVELTLDITNLAITTFETEDGDPLIQVGLASQPSRTVLLMPLDELVHEIAAAQDDKLWRLLRMTIRELDPKHHIE